MPSNSNRTAVGLTLEATPGTTPATPPFTGLRITGATLQYATKTEISKELRADRQLTDVIRVGYDPSGTLPIEIIHGALQPLLEGALFTAMTARYPLAVNAGSGDVITGCTTAVITAPGAWAVGDIVRLTGFTNQQNNGVFVAIAGTASGTITLAAASLIAETPQAGARIKKVGVQTTAGTIAATATGLTGVPALGLVAGEWVNIGGLTAITQFIAAGVLNNNFARLSANQAGGVLTFDIFPVGWAADTGTAQTIQLFVGEYARNGLTLRSYTIEEQFQDLVTPEFHYYIGMVVSKLMLTAKAQTIMTGQADFIGRTANILLARLAGATDVLAPGFPVQSASSLAGRIYQNNVPIAGNNFVTDAEVTIDNTLRKQVALASDGAIGIGIGRAMVSGKLNMYYGDDTILLNLRNNVASSFMMTSSGGDDTFGRDALLVDVPRIKYMAGDPTVAGIDTDRMLQLTWQGVRHPVYGFTIHCQQFEGFLGT